MNRKAIVKVKKTHANRKIGEGACGFGFRGCTICRGEKKGGSRVKA